MIEKSVKEFFDDHSTDYKKKYNRGNRFYEYFFFERLEKATQNLKMEGKSVLDIGAGTGPLYDFLNDTNTSFGSYFATDISNGMLNKSNIPKENQFIGDFTEFEFEQSFDYSFMLGVSTYLSKNQMIKHIDSVYANLNKSGIFIVTFTNSHSLDIFIRSIISPLRKVVSAKDRIMSQDFPTRYYSRKEVELMVAEKFIIKRIDGLNHTIFPFSRVFPKISIWMARSLFSKTRGRMNRFLSSDLLFVLEKR